MCVCANINTYIRSLFIHGNDDDDDPHPYKNEGAASSANFPISSLASLCRSASVITDVLESDMGLSAALVAARNTALRMLPPASAYCRPRDSKSIDSSRGASSGIRERHSLKQNPTKEEDKGEKEEEKISKVSLFHTYTHTNKHVQIN